MLRFMRRFSGKFQYFGNFAGVKHLTNIMSEHRLDVTSSYYLCCLIRPRIIWSLQSFQAKYWDKLFLWQKEKFITCLVLESLHGPLFQNFPRWSVPILTKISPDNSSSSFWQTGRISYFLPSDDSIESCNMIPGASYPTRKYNHLDRRCHWSPILDSFSFTAITNSAIDTIDWKLIFSFSFSAATGRFTATPACPHPRNPRSALHPQAWLLLRVRPPTHPNKKLKSVWKPGVWKCPSVSGWIDGMG